jgi:hypothetical protein
MLTSLQHCQGGIDIFFFLFIFIALLLLYNLHRFRVLSKGVAGG